jgi:hypothetical protein
MATRKPTSVDIITYQVGFGDCFLLRFNYAGRARARSLLIDFGSTKKNGYSLTDVSKQIATDCQGKLDVVVATHRHKDHVQGFARSTSGRGAGDVIRGLNPTAVVMPWTEDPRAEKDAIQPTKKYGAHGPSMVAQLGNMQMLAGAIAKQAKVHRFAEEKGLQKQLRALGENNLGNAKAMKNLREMGRRTYCRTYYAYHKMRLRLARELPGVKVHVLGPPTLKQTETIDKQRSRDQDEFWNLQATTTQDAIDAPLVFPNARELRNPIWGRRLRRRLRTARGEQLLSIVRSLDHAMNNTSLVLVIEVGSKKLLFSGDAQYENWMHALEKNWVKELLKGVDVYKIGHHGSLNATPKSMFKLFRKKRPRRVRGVMHSLLSTMEDVHGQVERKTEVPRKTLVKRLERDTQLLSTEDFEGEISQTISFDV